ncbi:MAG: DUF4124 domain-containing protein [Burkholderiales bacterium]
MNRRNISKTLPAVAVIVATLTAVTAIPVARADMWKCTDKEGSVRYTNVKSDAKGCQAVVLDPLNSVNPGKAAKSNPGPASFPSVSSAEQKARDGDRRKILDTELSNEERLLAEARKKLKEQEDLRLGSEKNFARVEERLVPFQKQVQLHESNIANIRKEITSLR